MQCREFSIMADLSDKIKSRVNFSANTLSQLIHSNPHRPEKYIPQNKIQL